MTKLIKKSQVIFEKVKYIAIVAIPYRAGSISAFNVKFLLTTNKEKVKAAGASPQTPLGRLTLTALP